jgi:hypothetical protein
MWIEYSLEISILEPKAQLIEFLSEEFARFAMKVMQADLGGLVA